MKKIMSASSVGNLHDALSELKGKKIQVVTTNGQQIRGTVSRVGRNFVVINGNSITNNGSSSSHIFFPFFFPFTSLLFFAPFFFRRRRFFF